MARQALVPGLFPAYINETGAKQRLTSAGFLNETGAPAVTGTLAATEAADVAAFVGDVASVGTLAATEASDTAAFVGDVASVGTLAATEAPDAAALTGDVAWVAILAATEAPDVAALVGDVASVGTLAATEGADLAAIAGDVSSVGTMAATDAPDVAAIAGDVASVGALAATDPADTASLTGSVASVGTLAATEATDVVAITGTVVAVTGTLVATEAVDVVAMAGTVVGFGVTFPYLLLPGSLPDRARLPINAALRILYTAAAAAMVRYTYTATIGTVAAGATTYLGVNAQQAAEDDTVFLMPFDGYLTAMRAAADAAPGAAETFIYTTRVDGVDTALTCTIAGASDISGEALGAVTVTQGQAVTIAELVTSAGAAAAHHRVALTLVAA